MYNKIIVKLKNPFLVFLKLISAFITTIKRIPNES